MKEWIYEKNQDNTARYLLGERGNRNLICIGINPSTATPSKLDTTVTRVKRIAERNDYDGWLMLNIYPQRDTYPQNIHVEEEQQLLQSNCEAVAKLLSQGDYKDVWAAWGTDIKRRPFLFNCLNHLVKCFDSNFNWLNYGELTKSGHPRHPSRMSYSEKFIKFDIQSYLELNQ